MIPRWADNPVRRQEEEDNGGDRTFDGRRRGRGGLIIVRKNKQRILRPEWSMSEVGTPPPHNAEKPHGLMDSINNNNKNTQKSFECEANCIQYRPKDTPKG